MSSMVEDGGAATNACDDLLGAFSEGAGLSAWELAPSESPLFIAPASDHLREPGALKEWLRRNMAGVEALLHRHGAIVLRGFAVPDTEAFSAVVEQFTPFVGDYRGSGSRRARISRDVHEVTQVPSPMKIRLHQEMSHLARAPRKIMFYCCRPAESGGETVIADVRGITRGLPPGLRDKLERLGVAYMRHFAAAENPDGAGQRSWQDAFSTSDREEVDAVCRARNQETIWHDDGRLSVRTTMPAFLDHEVTGERIYRNMLHCDGRRYSVVGDWSSGDHAALEAISARPDYGTGCFLGDGSELEVAEQRSLTALFDAAEQSWKWEAGDIMLLDNVLTAHGRNAFAGNRDVQVAVLD